MRKLFLVVGLCILANAASSSASVGNKAHPQQLEIKALADKIATEIGANKHIVLSQLMFRIEGVELAVGMPIDFSLALQVADCSDLAGHPDDPGKFGKGVEFSKIETELAIEKCTIAFRNGGDKLGLVLASLSRALNKAQDYKNSFAAANMAAALNYPYGDVLVGVHYFYGEGVAKNSGEQFRWYKSAAEKAMTVGMKETSNNYLTGTGTAVDLDLAYSWALKAIKGNDGKAFYQLGKVLEAISVDHKHSNHVLKLAKQSFEIASENGLNVRSDINEVNKTLLPNRFSPHALEFKNLSGRMVDGVFVEEDDYLKPIFPIKTVIFLLLPETHTNAIC
jgi:hypothetical protein